MLRAGQATTELTYTNDNKDINRLYWTTINTIGIYKYVAEQEAD